MLPYEPQGEQSASTVGADSISVRSALPNHNRRIEDNRRIEEELLWKHLHITMEKLARQKN